MQTYDYRILRQRYKLKKFKTVDDIKNGTWLPLSIAALLSNCSVQSLRLYGFKGFIKIGKFEDGPLLTQLESILEYRRNN